MSERQCPAVNAVREMSKTGAPRPRITLGKQILRSGDTLDVSVAAVPGMQIDVLLIDHQGVAYKFKTKPKSPGAVYDYEIKGITVELARRQREVSVARVGLFLARPAQVVRWLGTEGYGSSRRPDAETAGRNL